MRLKIFKLLLKYKELVKYTFVGLIGAAIDFGGLILFVEVFRIPILAANAISFIMAVINNFVLNKHWTFRDRDKNYARQFIKYLIVSIVGLGLNTAFMKILISIQIWYVPAKILIIFIVAVWNYLANKFWTFKIKSMEPVQSYEEVDNNTNI